MWRRLRRRSHRSSWLALGCEGESTSGRWRATRPWALPQSPPWLASCLERGVAGELGVGSAAHDLPRLPHPLQHRGVGDPAGEVDGPLQVLGVEHSRVGREPESRPVPQTALAEHQAPAPLCLLAPNPDGRGTFRNPGVQLVSAVEAENGEGHPDTPHASHRAQPPVYEGGRSLRGLPGLETMCSSHRIGGLLGQ